MLLLKMFLKLDILLLHRRRLFLMLKLALSAAVPITGIEAETNFSKPERLLGSRL